MRGAKYRAHPPLTAGRDQEYVIHYINNNQVVTEGEMVVIGVFSSGIYFIIDFMIDAEMHNFVVMFCLSLPLF